MRIFKWLFGYESGSKLNQLETLLLAKLQGSLSTPGRLLLARQLDQINLVQRHSRSREVCYYTMKGGKPFHDSTYQFPAQALELKFATIKFGQAASGRNWTAEFFMVKGYFFSIVFTPSPEDVQKIGDIEIQKVTVHHDPMKPTPGLLLRSVSAGEIHFHGWIREWNERYRLFDLFEPLSTEQRKKLIGDLETYLPLDYLEFIEVSEGGSLGNVEILGLSEIYEVVLPESSFYVVAIVNGEGVLATRKHPEDKRLYYLDYGRGDAARIDRSFREAVERFTAERKTS